MGLVDKRQTETQNWKPTGNNWNQALNTNSLWKNIYQQADSDKCSLYSIEVENITHKSPVENENVKEDNNNNNIKNIFLIK